MVKKFKKIFDAKVETEEVDEFELLVIVTTQYENEKIPKKFAGRKQR